MGRQAEAKTKPAILARERAPIVSSLHLASGLSPALSEVEYGVILITHAFSRWMVRGMAAAGLPGLSPTEVLVLHSIRHRDKPKKLADICLVLDIEDTHIATYAIRKLEAAGLVETGKAGKEKTIRISRKGREACDRYAMIREQLLVDAVTAGGPGEASLSEIAALLRSLSGAYEQATRAAATL